MTKSRTAWKDFARHEKIKNCSDSPVCAATKNPTRVVFPEGAVREASEGGHAFKGIGSSFGGLDGMVLSHATLVGPAARKDATGAGRGGVLSLPKRERRKRSGRRGAQARPGSGV